MTREPIYSALFAKVAGAYGFTTISRRLKHWDDVPQGDQPALFQAQMSEDAAIIAGRPTVWTMSVDLYIYAHTGGDKSIAPGTILNPLIDAVVAALAPDPITQLQTLGGTCIHAWIEGRVQTDEGVLGDQGVAIIPIHIKAI